MSSRNFVLIGPRAEASPNFRVDDLPSSSGRLDVLLRGLRAAMLVSHGLRTDTTTYLVLLGGWHAPRVLRMDSARVRYLRPDERSLALFVQKALALDVPDRGWVSTRTGVDVARGDTALALADAGGEVLLLDEAGDDVRRVSLPTPLTIVVGGPDGVDPVSLAALDAVGARRLSVGPVSLHADDAVAVVSNELDRRATG